MANQRLLMRFIQYWKENYTSAKEYADIVTVFWIMVLAIISFVVGIVASAHGKHIPILTSSVTETISGVGGLLLLLYVLLVVPFHRHEKLIECASELDIEPTTCPDGRSGCCCSVYIHNPSTEASEDVKVVLQSINPMPMTAASMTTYAQGITIPKADIRLPIPLPPILPGGDVIHPDSKSEFLIFQVAQHGFDVLLTIPHAPSNISCSPAVARQNGPDAEYVTYEIEIGASSLTQPPNTAKFKLSFATALGEKLWTLTKI